MPPTPDVLLKTLADLDALLGDPTPVLLFKHSTACPVSARAHAEFVRWLGVKPAQPRTALVRVIEERGVSQEITRRLRVTHQSPQAILIRGGEAVWHASHDAVTAEALSDAVASLPGD